MPTLEKYKGKVYLWHYIPNLPAAAAFAVLFAIATLAQTWKMVKTRTWLSLPFVVGGICTSSPAQSSPVPSDSVPPSQPANLLACPPS